MVTALNFCLALRPPLLKLTQELVNFLQEALSIAEADETVWVVKFMNPKVATSLTKLKTACIELLCTTMAWADFKTPNHSDLRAKIISMFFKSLICQTPEIVAVGKEGLRQVLLSFSYIIYVLFLDNDIYHVCIYFQGSIGFGLCYVLFSISRLVVWFVFLAK